MKRTSMFICCFALLASIVCETAFAQCPGGNCSTYSYGWWPWFTYPAQTYQPSRTCNSQACARMKSLSEAPQTVPATTDDSEAVVSEDSATETNEVVPAIVEEPATQPEGNPSLIIPPAEEEPAQDTSSVEEPADPEVVEVPLCPFAARVIVLINQHRARYGLPALKPDLRLVNGCQSHSAWMTHYGFQHAYGVGRECIAMGVNTPESLVNMWMNSSGHRAIIMGWGTWIGIGSAGTYHTLRIR